MKRVLVVEDEASIREMVALNLKMAGWDVVEAPSAERALELMHSGEHCDAALLDIMLPGMDGLSLCETIRRGDSDIGIIIVSAKGQESDKIRGLSIGADDYITKPFSVSELIARLEALTRRIHRGSGTAAKPAEEPEQLVSGPFVLDEKSRILYKSGKPIDLTQVEFQIMELFFRNPGTALVREKILEGVWGKNYFGDVKIVDVNIRRLRMKIEDEPSRAAADGRISAGSGPAPGKARAGAVCWTRGRCRARPHRRPSARRPQRRPAGRQTHRRPAAGKNPRSRGRGFLHSAPCGRPQRR